MKPVVSIIIPAYNAGKFISETLFSVINQTYKEREIILIDDGSTDNTFDLVREFITIDSQVKIIQKENSGVSDSRNLGLNISNGEIVCFLDADDIWNPGNLEVKVNALYNNNWDAVYSSCSLIDKNSDLMGRSLIGSSDISLYDLLELKGNYIAAPSGFLYRKSIFIKTGGFDPLLSNNADQEMLARILSYKFKVGYIPDDLWKYRLHSQNMSGNLRLLEEDSIEMFRKYKKLHFFKNSKHERECFAKLYYMLGGSWWKNGKNKLTGAVFFAKSFFTYPPVLLNFLKK